jgi:hypothetical protein
VPAWPSGNVTFSSLEKRSQKHLTFLRFFFQFGNAEVLFQPVILISTTTPTSITIENPQLKTLQDFKYLGSTFSNDGSLDKAISARMRKTCVCDRSAGDAYSYMTPDPTSDIFRDPCTPIL